MPERWIMVNWDQRDKIVGITHRIKAVVYEETAHLISKLERYEVADHKWAEEMMARVIAFGMPTGHKKDDPNSRRVRQELSADSYLRLFHLVNKFVGNEQTLLSMFFGREPRDSEDVKRVGVALEQLKPIGEVIDAGVSLDALGEYLRQ